MKYNQYIFEMMCENCKRKFISKIKKPVLCPYCSNVTDKVTRVVKVENDPKLGHVYIDVATGKYLRVKNRGNLIGRKN